MATIFIRLFLLARGNNKKDRTTATNNAIHKCRVSDPTTPSNITKTTGMVRLLNIFLPLAIKFNINIIATTK